MIPILCFLTIIWQDDHLIPLEKWLYRIRISGTNLLPHHIIVAEIVAAILQKLDFMVLSFRKQDNTQLSQTICTLTCPSFANSGRRI